MDFFDRIIESKNLQIVMISSFLSYLWFSSSPIVGLVQKNLIPEEQISIELVLGSAFWLFLIIMLYKIYEKTKIKIKKYIDFATLIATIGSFLILTSSFMLNNSNSLHSQINDMALAQNQTLSEYNHLLNESVDIQINNNSIEIHTFDRLSYGFLLSGLVLVIFSFFVVMLEMKNNP